MKLLICFGTRPEAIKMAPILFELRKRKVNYKVCISGQHKEMLNQVLAFFNIVPDYNLNLMRASQSLNQLAGNTLLSVDEVLSKENPDLVLVHGDTTTSVTIAMAAFHKKIKVGHIEAGLRTFNKEAPFPEEINRQLTARIADYNFAPTREAKENLLKENVIADSIFVTGNTVVDALIWAKKQVENEKFSNKEIEDLNSRIDLSKDIVLVTGHRRESFGDPNKRIFEALIEIARGANVQVIYPVHLNPLVKESVLSHLGEEKNILLTPPVSYSTMLWLMLNSKLIISDSGGIQEEAPSMGKPLLVTREFSERMEGVNAGFSVIVGTEKEKIVLEANRVLKNDLEFPRGVNPYGDGLASIRIVDFILSRINI